MESDGPQETVVMFPGGCAVSAAALIRSRASGHSATPVDLHEPAINSQVS